TLRLLSEAGVSTGILIAPIIPGLNDVEIPGLLERARNAGATHAGMVLLRLPAEVLPVFDERLGEAFPERAAKVRSGIRELRGGKMNESSFGARMEGTGARWNAIQSLFDVHVKKLGLNSEHVRAPEETTYRRPSKQGRLFDI